MLVAHAEGVEVYPGTLISKAACEEGKVTITTEDGKEVGEGRGVCGCVLGEGEGCVWMCVGRKGGGGGGGSSYHDCLLKNGSQFCDDKLILMKVLEKLKSVKIGLWPPYIDNAAYIARLSLLSATESNVA